MEQHESILEADGPEWIEFPVKNILSDETATTLRGWYRLIGDKMEIRTPIDANWPRAHSFATMFPWQVDWKPVVTGFSTLPEMYPSCDLQDGKAVLRIMHLKRGVSNSSEFTFSLPFVSAENVSEPFVAGDNGTLMVAVVTIKKGSKTAIVTPQRGSNLWASAGEKWLNIETLKYKIAPVKRKKFNVFDTLDGWLGSIRG